MSQHDEELLNAIDKMINERTFSLEAVEAVKKMREELNSCKIDIKVSEKSCDEYKERLKKSEEFGNITDKSLKECQDRERSVELREETMLRLELNAEKHVEVRDAYINCFETVFKNTIIREEIQRQIVTPLEGTPGVSGGMGIPGIGQKDQVTENRETTKE